MTKEEVAVIAAKQQNAKYDAISKENLKHPKLIAPILKAVVPEYKRYTVEQVIDFIIKDSINDDPVDDVSVIANSLDTEMSSVSEKLIRYDSRFKAINPELSDKTISFYLHIDLEVQNNYKPTNPEYPIIKRAIYYGAREISSQLGILTEKTNYGDLEKVYSIWICNENVPRKLQNTVTSYQFTKKDEIGKCDEPDVDYDLINVIIIRRGKETGDSDIFDYLTSYFNSNIDGICRHVDIRNDIEIMEGVKRMTGLGQSIHDKAYVQGITRGRIIQLIELAKEGVITLADAAQRANMSEEEFVKNMNILK